MNNLDYFDLAIAHKEVLIDQDYYKEIDCLIIPKTKEEKNKLTDSNEKVIRYISTVETLIKDLHYEVDNDDVVKTLLLLKDELKTKGMNYSAFCQYFNVHNLNYSIFSKLNDEEQLRVLQSVIKPYLITRHDIYLSHGYSDIVLQVMCDNYSHKRKSNYGVKKIEKLMEKLKVPDLAKMPKDAPKPDSYYLLSDKTGKTIYKRIASEYKINLSEKEKETIKYPDAFIKLGKHIFVIEQKNMKESGGGQDKQTLEITDFISRQPNHVSAHYVTYVDGIFFNQLNASATAKTHDQYNDIIHVLKKYKSNYFVNSYAFEALMNSYRDDSLKSHR